MKYGKFSLTWNGGEILALNNALLLSSNEKELPEIIFEFEINDMALLTGFAGTDPEKLGRYLSYHKIGYKQFSIKKDFEANMSEGGVFILSYWNGRSFMDMKGLHTVAGKCSDEKITVYNQFSKDENLRCYENFDKLLDGKSYITGYFICSGGKI